MTAGAEWAIDIRALEQRFGGQTALQGLSAQIKRGLITGLVGPDGAGKTTLMRLLAGLMKPSAGSLCVEGPPYRAS